MSFRRCMLKTFHLNTGACELHHIQISGIIVGIASQLAHKHDIGIGLLKLVLMGFYCDYVHEFLYDLVLHIM
jgi:hypothetical protein